MSVDPRRDQCLLPMGLRPSACPQSGGDVSGGNYFEFDEDGFLQFFGEGQGWMDFNFGIGNLSRGASAPDIIHLSATNIEVLAFDGAATAEEVSVALEMNHNWAEETTVYPHVHWYPTTTGAGDVVWQMEYAFVAPGATVGASTTIIVTQAGGGTAWAERFASFPTVSAAGLLIGTQLHLRLFRDPTHVSDTYGADAAIATFGLHVLIDTIGSREITSK